MVALALVQERYPDVLLDETRMLVPTDIGVTAGSAMGHLDLALWLVQQVSPELADARSHAICWPISDRPRRPTSSSAIWRRPTS